MSLSELQHRHWIVVPCYNEAKWISGVIDAIAAQKRRDFALVIVNNASTDGTRALAHARIAAHPHLRGVVIDEPEKGTGCAADTGFRYAIAHRAEIICRTDADCLPRPAWFGELMRALEERELDCVAGRLKIRTDDVHLSPAQLLISRVGITAVRLLGPWVRSNRVGDGYLRRYVMLPGPNVGIRASAYEACGGYRRTSFDVAFLDKEIANAMRRHTSKIAYVRSAPVMFSERRTKAYGVRGTVSWIRSRGGVKTSVDVR
ncbi:MAG: glycosyl transferase [Thermoleophilia bacterium]|nr:glycosyl transferase [Thermoleophilia bacterium]